MLPENLEETISKTLAGVALHGIGDFDPQQAGEAIRTIASALAQPDDNTTLITSCLVQIFDSADPRMALNNLQRFVDAYPDRAELTQLLTNTPAVVPTLVTLLAGSQFLSDVLISQPAVFPWLIDSETLSGARPPDYYRDGIDAITTGLSERQAQRRAISLWRRKEYLRIGLRDLLLTDDAEDVSRDISDLAQAIIDKAAQIVYAELSTRFGEPVPEGISSHDTETSSLNTTPAHGNQFGSGMCVLGMGKLGGRELNFSSDIDLIFVYEDEGETTGRLDGERRVAVISNHDFFARMGEQLVKFLAERGPEGNLFRVDMRLRPEGMDGPLARSLESFVHYLNSQARDWERLAYLKARVVSGPRRLAEKIYRVMAPFVFAGLDAQRIVSEIEELKLRIDREVMNSDTYKRDVKRGFGGIREIEFVVAAMQIIHGYHHHALRVRNTFLALQRLLETHIISAETAEFYQYAYSFLRTIEHRLQMAQEAQTHTLPPPGPEFNAMAHRCGFADSADFQREFERVTTAVHQRFTEFFKRDTQVLEQANRDILTILDRSASPDVASGALERQGLHDPDAIRLIHSLAYGTRDVFVTAEGQKSFEQMLPALLRLTAAAPMPAKVLAQFHSFALAIKGITYYYEVIAQHPDILKLLVTLFGTSEALSAQLIAHPEFFDSLISTRVLNEADPKGLARRERMTTALSVRRIERRFTMLRRVTHFERLVIALQYLLKLKPIQECLTSLSQTADIALSLAVELAVTKLLTKWNNDTLPDNAVMKSVCDHLADSFSIIALGKYGGQELNFYGDLDVVFVYDSNVELPEIVHTQMSSPQEFYDTLADGILAAIGEQMTGGKAFEIDPRLRPHGRSAPLSTEISAYEDYLRDEAETWELQSFQRARCAWGTPALVTRLAHAWKDATAKFTSKAIGTEISAMRARLEETILDDTDTMELKRSAGGIVDVEFLLQYIALTNAMPLTPGYANYFVFLNAMPGQIMDKTTSRSLLDSYTKLRSIENTIRLVTGTTKSSLQITTSSATAVARSRSYSTPEELAEDVNEAKRKIRKAFAQTLP